MGVRSKHGHGQRTRPWAVSTILTHLPPFPQPTVNDPASPAALPSTAGLFFQQFFTVRDAAYSYPAAQNYIDVRDIADAFVRALETPAAGGERIIVASRTSLSTSPGVSLGLQLTLSV